MAILEAMATARPVLAVAEGGPRTVVADGEGGYLVPRGDVEAMAERMVRLLSDRGAAERMGAFNRRRIEERYAVEVVVPRLEAVLADARR
jgi:glycosyltransferase involved in cell wall biosynthesis